MTSTTIPLSAEELRVRLVSEEKYLEDRILHVERHFALLANDLGAMVRKTAHLRDKGDRITKTLCELASHELGDFKKGVEGIAECFSALEDCNQLKIDKMEAKVVKPFLEYGNICKKAKEELKSVKAVGEREVNKQRALDRIRIRDPTNRKKLAQLESDLQKVKIERLRITKSAEEYMEGFEKKRTQDFKSIMKEFIHAQLTFHARAMELYTAAYQQTQNIRDDEIVEVYQKGLQPRMPQNQATRSRSTSPAAASAPPVAGYPTDHLTAPSPT